MPESPIEQPEEAAIFTRGAAKVVAACFALAAFGVAVVSGLAIGNSAARILGRALAVMIVCYPIGWMVGLICQHVIDEHVRAHKQANPAPDSLEEISPERTSSSAEAQKDDEEIMVV